VSSALGIQVIPRPFCIDILALRPFCHQLCQVPRVFSCGLRPMVQRLAAQCLRFRFHLTPVRLNAMRPRGCPVAQRHAAQWLPCGSALTSVFSSMSCGSTPCGQTPCGSRPVAQRPVVRNPVMQRLVAQRPVVYVIRFNVLQLNVLCFNALRLDKAPHPGSQHCDYPLTGSQLSPLPTAASHPGSQHIH
jgi:hypothetical protein